jgi:hypothetical protein
VIALGVTDTALKAATGGFTVKPNMAFTLEYVAVRVTGVEPVTLPVLTVNVAELAPCGTVTVAGTLAAVLLELESNSDTIAPPLPAAAVRLTVPVADCPLTMVLGLTDTLLKAPGSGVTVMPKVAFNPA